MPSESVPRRKTGLKKPYRLVPVHKPARRSRTIPTYTMHTSIRYISTYLIKPHLTHAHWALGLSLSPRLRLPGTLILSVHTYRPTNHPLHNTPDPPSFPASNTSTFPANRIALHILPYRHIIKMAFCNRISSPFFSSSFSTSSFNNPVFKHQHPPLRRVGFFSFPVDLSMFFIWVCYHHHPWEEGRNAGRHAGRHPAYWVAHLGTSHRSFRHAAREGSCIPCILLRRGNIASGEF